MATAMRSSTLFLLAAALLVAVNTAHAANEADAGQQSGPLRHLLVEQTCTAAKALQGACGTLCPCVVQNTPPPVPADAADVCSSACEACAEATKSCTDDTLPDACSKYTDQPGVKKCLGL